MLQLPHLNRTSLARDKGKRLQKLLRMGSTGQNKAPKAGNSPSLCSISWSTLTNPKEIVYPRACLEGALF